MSLNNYIEIKRMFITLLTLVLGKAHLCKRLKKLKIARLILLLTQKNNWSWKKDEKNKEVCIKFTLSC